MDARTRYWRWQLFWNWRQLVRDQWFTLLSANYNCDWGQLKRFRLWYWDNTTTRRTARTTRRHRDRYVWLHSFVNYSDWLRLGELSEFDVCSVWPIGGCLVLVLFLVCIEELESLKRIWRLIMTRSIPDSVEYGGRRMSKTKMVYDDISNVCVCVYAYYFTI
jgi:hypothetical protein